MIAFCKSTVINITNIKYIRLKFEDFPGQAIFYWLFNESFPVICLIRNFPSWNENISEEFILGIHGWGWRQSVE